jgi:hypothetical protein
MKLSIPEEYADLVIVETPEEETLFVVSEKESVEAAGEEEDGAGWLFSIKKIDEEKLHEMLCYDMSADDIFAAEENGNHYVYNHPTDVRVVRKNNDDYYSEESMASWSMLCDWAATVKDSFVEENEGLTKESYGNTTIDMYLARIAYMDDVEYTISTTEFGPLEPKDVDPAPYLERLTNNVIFESDYEGEAPDGEYVVLNFPEDDIRFDFFSADKNYIRRTASEGEDYEEFIRADYEDGSVNAMDIMEEWYHALAEANGKF